MFPTPHSRRSFLKFGAAALAAGAAVTRSLPAWAAAGDPDFAGLAMGAQSYTFRSMSFEKCCQAMNQLGLPHIEVYPGHVAGLSPTQIKDILSSPYEKDRVTVPVQIAEDGKPFMGDNFKTTLKDLEAKMREAAANLEFETAARLRDEIKRLKLLDLEFAADALAGDGQTGDREAVKAVRAEARAEKQDAFRKRGRARRGV